MVVGEHSTAVPLPQRRAQVGTECCEVGFGSPQRVVQQEQRSTLGELREVERTTVTAVAVVGSAGGLERHDPFRSPGQLPPLRRGSTGVAPEHLDETPTAQAHRDVDRGRGDPTFRLLVRIVERDEDRRASVLVLELREDGRVGNRLPALDRQHRQPRVGERRVPLHSVEAHLIPSHHGGRVLSTVSVCTSLDSPSRTEGRDPSSWSTG